MGKYDDIIDGESSPETLPAQSKYGDIIEADTAEQKPSKYADIVEEAIPTTAHVTIDPQPFKPVVAETSKMDKPPSTADSVVKRSEAVPTKAPIVLPTDPRAVAAMERARAARNEEAEAFQRKLLGLPPANETPEDTRMRKLRTLEVARRYGDVYAARAVIADLDPDTRRQVENANKQDKLISMAAGYAALGAAAGIVAPARAVLFAAAGTNVKPVTADAGQRIAPLVDSIAEIPYSKDLPAPDFLAFEGIPGLDSEDLWNTVRKSWLGYRTSSAVSQAEATQHPGDVAAYMSLRDKLDRVPPSRYELAAQKAQQTGSIAPIAAEFAPGQLMNTLMALNLQSTAMFVPSMIEHAPEAIAAGGLGAMNANTILTFMASRSMEGAGMMEQVLQERMKTAGADPNDPEQVLAVLGEPQTREIMHQQANAKGIPIAMVDAALTRIMPFATIAQTAKRAARVKNTVKLAVAEGIGSGAGEVAGELTAGEDLSPADIIAEVFGDGTKTAYDIASAGITDPRGAKAKVLQDIRATADPEERAKKLDEAGYKNAAARVRFYADAEKTAYEKATAAEAEIIAKGTPPEIAGMFGDAIRAYGTAKDKPSTEKAQALRQAAEEAYRTWREQETQANQRPDATPPPVPGQPPAPTTPPASAQPEAVPTETPLKTPAIAPDQQDAQTQAPTAEATSMEQAGGKTASIPLMITRQMTEDLRTRGYSDEEINKLRPEQASEILSRPSPGERKAPVEAKTPDDIRTAEKVINQNATPAQKEAENFKQAHVRVQGYDLTLETAKGSTRTAADGSWSVPNFPASYGKIKGSKGRDWTADKPQQLDAYVGDNPASDRVFVIDQLTPKTGEFDEHKVMLGFNTEAEARTAYEKAFSDGSGPARIQAITQTTKEHLDDFIASGRDSEAVRNTDYATYEIGRNQPAQAQTPTEGVPTTVPAAGTGKPPVQTDVTPRGEVLSPPAAQSPTTMKGGTDVRIDTVRQPSVTEAVEQSPPPDQARIVEGVPTEAPKPKQEIRNEVPEEKQQADVVPVQPRLDEEDGAVPREGRQVRQEKVADWKTAFEFFKQSTPAKDRKVLADRGSEYAFDLADMPDENLYTYFTNTLRTIRGIQGKGAAWQDSAYRLQATAAYNELRKRGVKSLYSESIEAYQTADEKPQTQLTQGDETNVPRGTTPAWNPESETLAKSGRNPHPDAVPSLIPAIGRPEKSKLMARSPIIINGHKGAGIENSKELAGIYAAGARHASVVADMFAGSAIVDMFLAMNGLLQGKTHIMSEWEPLRAIAWRQIAGDNWKQVQTEAEQMGKEVLTMLKAVRDMANEAKKHKNESFRLINQWKRFILDMGNLSNGKINDIDWVEELVKPADGRRMEYYAKLTKKFIEKNKREPTPAEAAEILVRSMFVQTVRHWSQMKIADRMDPAENLLRYQSELGVFKGKFESLSATAEALSSNSAKSKPTEKMSPDIIAALERSLTKMKQGLPTLRPLRLKDDPTTAAFGIVVQWATGGQLAATTEPERDGSMLGPATTYVNIDEDTSTDKMVKAVELAHKSIAGANIYQGDSWRKMVDLSAQHNGIFLVVDPSYFAEAKEDGASRDINNRKNYGIATDIKRPEDLLYYVDTYLIPAWNNGARISLTNTYDKWLVGELRLRGFNVAEFSRANEEPEFVAYNFNPVTGAVLASNPKYAGAEAPRESPARGEMSTEQATAMRGDSGTDPLTRDTDQAAWAERNPKSAAVLRAMVESAAKDAGYTIGPVYHGTPTGGFNTFKKGEGDTPFGRVQRRPGISFHYDRKLAEVYAKDKEPLSREDAPIPEVKEVYLRAAKIWDYENPDHMKMAVDAIKAHPEFDSWMLEELDNGDWEIIESGPVQKAIKGSGFDAFFSNDHPGKAIQVYKSSQAKSADLATFRDDGTPYAVEKRFQADSNDIRESPSRMDTDTLRSMRRKVDRLYSTGRGSDAENLDARLEDLIERTSTDAEATAVESGGDANDLEYDPSMDPQELSIEEQLRALYDDYAIDQNGLLRADYPTLGAYIRSALNGEGPWIIKDGVSDEQLEAGAQDAVLAHQQRRDRLAGLRESPARWIGTVEYAKYKKKAFDEKIWHDEKYIRKLIRENSPDRHLAVLEYWQSHGFVEIASADFPDITKLFEEAVDRLTSLPLLGHTVMRFQGYATAEERDAYLKGYKPGAIIRVDRPVNAFSNQEAYGRDMASSYGGDYHIKFVINSPKTAKMISHGSMDQMASEVLYPRGAAFRVESVKTERNNGGPDDIVVTLKESKSEKNTPIRFSPSRATKRIGGQYNAFAEYMDDIGPIFVPYLMTKAAGRRGQIVINSKRFPNHKDEYLSIIDFMMTMQADIDAEQDPVRKRVMRATWNAWFTNKPSDVLSTEPMIDEVKDGFVSFVDPEGERVAGDSDYDFMAELERAWKARTSEDTRTEEDLYYKAAEMLAITEMRQGVGERWRNDPDAQKIGRSVDNPYQYQGTEVYKDESGTWHVKMPNRGWLALVNGREAYNRLSRFYEARENEIYSDRPQDEENVDETPAAEQPYVAPITGNTDINASPERASATLDAERDDAGAEADAGDWTQAEPDADIKADSALNAGRPTTKEAITAAASIKEVYRKAGIQTDRLESVRPSLPMLENEAWKPAYIMAGLAGHKLVPVRWNLRTNGAVYDDTIYVSDRTDMPVMTTAGHEILHLWEQKYGDTPRGIALRQALDELAPADRLDAYRKELGRNHRLPSGMTTAQRERWLREELYADLLGESVTKQAFWERLAEISTDAFRSLYRMLGRIVSKMMGVDPAYSTDPYFTNLVKARDIAAEIYRMMVQDGTISEATGTERMSPARTMNMMPGWETTKSGKIIGYRGGEGKGKNQSLGTEGNGLYVSKTKDTAAFFGTVTKRVFDSPNSPLVVDEEPLYLLGEEDEIMEPIKPTDSRWTRLNKQARIDTGTTDETWSKNMPNMQDRLTKLIMDLGYDSVIVKSGGEEWAVLFENAPGADLFKFSPTRRTSSVTPERESPARIDNGIDESREPRYVTSWRDLKNSGFGTGYFMLPDGRMMDITSDFGGGSEDHVGFTLGLEHPEILGVSKATVEGAKAMNFEVTDEEGSPAAWYDDLWREIEAAGVVRVRIFPRRKTSGFIVSIQFVPPGRRGIKLMQDMALNGAIPTGNNVEYSFEEAGQGEWGTFKGTDELMAAKTIRDASRQSPARKDATEGNYLDMVKEAYNAPPPGWRTHRLSMREMNDATIEEWYKEALGYPHHYEKIPDFIQETMTAAKDVMRSYESFPELAADILRDEKWIGGEAQIQRMALALIVHNTYREALFEARRENLKEDEKFIVEQALPMNEFLNAMNLSMGRTLNLNKANRNTYSNPADIDAWYNRTVMKIAETMTTEQERKALDDALKVGTEAADERDAQIASIVAELTTLQQAYKEQGDKYAALLTRKNLEATNVIRRRQEQKDWQTGEIAQAIIQEGRDARKKAREGVIASLDALGASMGLRMSPERTRVDIPPSLPLSVYEALVQAVYDGLAEGEISLIEGSSGQDVAFLQNLVGADRYEAMVSGQSYEIITEAKLRFAEAMQRHEAKRGKKRRKGEPDMRAALAFEDSELGQQMKKNEALKNLVGPIQQHLRDDAANPLTPQEQESAVTKIAHDMDEAEIDMNDLLKERGIVTGSFLGPLFTAAGNISDAEANARYERIQKRNENAYRAWKAQQENIKPADVVLPTDETEEISIASLLPPELADKMAGLPLFRASRGNKTWTQAEIDAMWNKPVGDAMKPSSLDLIRTTMTEEEYQGFIKQKFGDLFAENINAAGEPAPRSTAILGTPITKLLNPAIIGRTIRQQIRDLQTTAQSILTSHYTTKDRLKANLIAKLREGLNLSPYQAIVLANEVDGIMKGFYARERLKAAKRFKAIFDSTETGGRNKKALHDLLAMINAGIFEDRALIKTWANAVGATHMTDADYETMLGYAPKIKEAHFDFEASERINELFQFVHSKTPARAGEILRWFIYTNLLSGYKDDVRNLVYSTVSTLDMMVTLAGKNPKRLAASMYAAVANRSIHGGFTEAAAAMAGNPVAKHIGALDISRDFVPATPGLRQYAQAATLLALRPLGAMDMLITKQSQDVVMHVLATAQMTESGMSERAARRKATELVYGTKAARKQWWKDAKEAYPTTGLTGKAKAAQILRQHRAFEESRMRQIDGDLRAKGLEWASIGMSNNVPEGLTGEAYRAVMSLTQSINGKYGPVGKYAAQAHSLFMRIASNIINADLSMFPIWIFGRKPKSFRRDTPAHQKSFYRRREITGHALIALVYAFDWWAETPSEDDDEDEKKERKVTPPFACYGFGPNDPTERAAWIESGGRPFSLRLPIDIPGVGKKGDLLDYRQLAPFSFVLAAAGVMADVRRGWIKVKDPTIVDQITYVATGVIRAIAGSTFLTTYAKTFDLIGGSSYAENIADVAAQSIGNAVHMLTPQSALIKQLNELFTSTVYQDDVMADGTPTSGWRKFAAYTLRNMPFADHWLKPRINALGDIVDKEKVGIFVNEWAPDPVYNWLMKEDLTHVVMRGPSVSTRIGDKEDGHNDPNTGRLDPNDHYNLTVYSGQAIKAAITAELAKVKPAWGTTPEQKEKWLEDTRSKALEDAKKKIIRED